MRTKIICESGWLEKLSVGMRKWATNEAGVTSIKMISECLLHLAHDTTSIPILVQKVSPPILYSFLGHIESHN